jgi:hypothetical protein
MPDTVRRDPFARLQDPRALHVKGKHHPVSRFEITATCRASVGGRGAGRYCSKQ